MKKIKSSNNKVLAVFERFENVVTIILSSIIALAIVISLIRILINFYQLFILDIDSPSEISFKNYQELFGKIMTLLISMEFLSSILKVLKLHQVKILVLDVILITVLAIARKLIIFDYEHHDANYILSLGILLVSLGVVYFLIKFEKSKRLSTEKRLQTEESGL